MSALNYNVLTLYLVKDRKAFNERNFRSVLLQKGVRQDVFIVSAEALGLPNNIVVPVPQKYPLPVRVGFSVNVALKNIGDISQYTHIFKVDGDVELPKDYLLNLLLKKAPVAGRGAALLISTSFFKNFLKGKYPVSYCDDGYVSALSISLGYWPPEYNGGKPFKNFLRPGKHSEIDSLRVYRYGREYYKWGMPVHVLILVSLLSAIREMKDVRSLPSHLRIFTYIMAGYFSALINNERRYPWWRNYASRRGHHFAAKFIQLLLRNICHSLG